MGIFSRFKDIINANINSILDKAEDPEKMIRLMIREMEDTLVDLKSSCAGKMAESARTKRNFSQAEEELNKLARLAETALSKNREDLAREALMHKKTAQNRLDILQQEADNLKNVIDDSKTNITQLETKLEEVRQKHRLLILRSKQAEEKRRTNENIEVAKGQKAVMRFEDFESKIERMEADAEISGMPKANHLEQEIMDLENQGELDKELEELKKKMKN
ncbi:MAG: PspA/IM30 family protein [Spirochaetaceae bacterium]|jgi:phage shock protein A|nr:PspA/IM30 family protein [Spirochaetaceae bacterium]